MKESNSSTLKQKCQNCGEELLIKDLRGHLQQCASEEFGDDSDYFFDDEILEHSAFSRQSEANQTNIQECC